MHHLPPDDRHLDRSLDLAEEAATFASPNPTVGCVLARGELVLGEGAHFYDSRDHAEVAALKAAAALDADVHGATAYVTLEPCSHHGRTGPCADALVAAGVRRCVVATVDPNPLVRGSGLAKLRAAGVDVYLLDPASAQAQRARRLNDAFAFSVQQGRPFVTLKAAVSQDGKLAPAPGKRTAAAPFWLTGTAAREDVQRLRHRSDAILTGIGTVLADDPSMTDRTGLPRRRPLLRVVLDAGLRIPLHSRLVLSAQQDVLVLASMEAPAERETEVRARGVEVIRCPAHDGRLELDYVLAALAAYPARSVLVEAGSVLNGSMLAQGLVDRVFLYRAPVELGPEALPFASGTEPDEVAKRLTERQERLFLNGEAFDQLVSGYLHDPWTGVTGVV